MSQVTVDIIIFAAIAVFLFFKLRNVLGEVDESEQKPAVKQPVKTKTPSKTEQERMAKLNRLSVQFGPGHWPTVTPDFKLVMNATTHNNLLNVHKTYPQFDPYDFLQGAKRALPMIIEAVSKGDKTTLKNLLSEEIFSLYEEEIDRRRSQGETWDSDVTDIKSALISGVEVDGSRTELTVDYEAVEKITARDKEGNFIDDQDGRTEKTKYRWQFAKDMTSNNHIWTLIQADIIGE